MGGEGAGRRPSPAARRPGAPGAADPVVLGVSVLRPALRRLRADDAQRRAVEHRLGGLLGLRGGALAQQPAEVGAGSGRET